MTIFSIHPSWLEEKNRKYNSTTNRSIGNNLLEERGHIPQETNFWSTNQTEDILLEKKLSSLRDRDRYGKLQFCRRKIDLNIVAMKPQTKVNVFPSHYRLTLKS